MDWSSAIATRSRKPPIDWSQNGEMPSTYSAELIVVEQQRAERGADDAAAAAEDRDTADHDSGDHLKLVAGASGGVDRAVLRCPQHAGDAGDGAADREGGEHPPADREARRAAPPPGWSRSRKGPVPSGSSAGSRLRGAITAATRWPGRECRPTVAFGMLRKASGSERGDDLVAADDQDVDAADDVQRRQGDDQARHPPRGDHEAVGDPAGQADTQAGQEHHGDVDARMRRRTAWSTGTRRARPPSRSTGPRSC